VKRAAVTLLVLLGTMIIFATMGAEWALAAQLDVPSWDQGDPRWAGVRLDGSPYTMKGSGCAVTSSAMVAAYFGSTKDPGQLCRALSANGGLDSQGRIYWEKVPAAAGGTIIYFGRFDYPGQADLARINRELDAGYPVIAEVRRSGSTHYVVLTGREGSTYSINDSGYADGTLNSHYGSPATAIRGIRVYHGRHEAPAPDQRFIDVFPSHPYYAAIQIIAERGIVSGYLRADGSARFRPDGPLLRAQFAKIVSGGFGITVDETLKSGFTDMGLDNPRDLYPHNYVAAAAAAGIVQGKTPESFDPWSNLTRAQMVTMVVRAAQNLFPDKLTTPPADYIGTVAGFDAAHDQNLRVAEYNDLLRGLVGFGPSWSPGAAGSRGEMAQVVYNWLVRAGPNTPDEPALVSTGRMVVVPPE